MSGAGLTDDEVMLAGAAMAFASSLGRNDNETIWWQLVKHGWTGTLAQIADGGTGGSPTDLLLLAQALGFHRVSAPFLAFGAMTVPLLDGAVSPLRSEWLAGHLDGTAPVATAWLETSGDPLGHRVAARLETAGSQLVLNGTKRMVLGGPVASALIVSAAEQRAGADSMRLMMVPVRAPGVSLTSYRLVDGSSAADVTFDNVELSIEAIVAADRAQQLLGRALDTAIIATLGEAIGCLEGALGQTIEHVTTRQQFGAPLAALQVIRHRIADMYIALEQLRSLGLAAARAWQTSDRAAAVHAAKIHLGRKGVWAAEQAIQLHGAMGVTEDCNIGKFLKRMIVLDRLFGNADYHAAQFEKLLLPITP